MEGLINLAVGDERQGARSAITETCKLIDSRDDKTAYRSDLLAEEMDQRFLIDKTACRRLREKIAPVKRSNTTIVHR